MRKLGEHPWLVDLTLLLVAVVWGSSYLTTKDVVTPATVIAVLALRFAISVPAMALFSLSGLRRTNSAEVWIGGLLGLTITLLFAGTMITPQSTAHSTALEQVAQLKTSSK
ncbi:hypothetical protein ACFQ1S_28220, partial [Kibdelosporangium lantanae]